MTYKKHISPSDVQIYHNDVKLQYQPVWRKIYHYDVQETYQPVWRKIYHYDVRETYQPVWRKIYHYDVQETYQPVWRKIYHYDVRETYQPVWRNIYHYDVQETYQHVSRRNIIIYDILSRQTRTYFYRKCFSIKVFNCRLLLRCPHCDICICIDVTCPKHLRNVVFRDYWGCSILIPLRAGTDLRRQSLTQRCHNTV